MESTRRNLAPQMSRAGCSYKAIIKATGYQMTKVHLTVVELKMTGMSNFDLGLSLPPLFDGFVVFV